MKQRPRIHYTESQKALMWERWQKGESLQQIAQLFDRNHSSIQPILAATGGIRPAPRCRSRLALTLAEREEISRAVVAGHSIRAIAAQLGRAPSTISREIKRNGGQGFADRVSCFLQRSTTPLKHGGRFITLINPHVGHPVCCYRDGVSPSLRQLFLVRRHR